MCFKVQSQAKFPFTCPRPEAPRHTSKGTEVTQGHEGHPSRKGLGRGTLGTALEERRNGFAPQPPAASLDLTQNYPHAKTKGEVETRGNSHPSPRWDVLHLGGRSARSGVETSRTTTVLGFCTSEGDMGERRVLRCHHPSMAACFLRS